MRNTQRVPISYLKIVISFVIFFNINLFDIRRDMIRSSRIKMPCLIEDCGGVVLSNVSLFLWVSGIRPSRVKVNLIFPLPTSNSFVSYFVTQLVELTTFSCIILAGWLRWFKGTCWARGRKIYCECSSRVWLHRCKASVFLLHASFYNT